MLNAIWVAMIVGAIVCGALTGSLDAVAKASTDSAKAGVELAIGLVGVMAFWLGLMRVLHKGGLLTAMAKVMRPVMTRLFPEVPPDHPAMSMMILNMVSNMLGLGNAATPFGLKAMMELNKLNPRKGTATNSMALFLAINTSGLAVLPTGMIAMRASIGANAPGSIFLTTILATMMSTVVAIGVAKVLCRLPRYRLEPALPGGGEVEVVEESAQAIDTTAAEEEFSQGMQEATSRERWTGRLLVVGVVLAFGLALQRRAAEVVEGELLGWGGALRSAVTDWPLAILIVGFVLFGVCRGVKVYDAVVEGGKEGFDVAIKIIPYLVAILVAVGMLRASGAIDMLVDILEPLTTMIGMPAETLPMAFLRSLSGSGAFGVSAELMNTHGPDSLIGNIVSTMQGSTETTFYVLALYFGAVQVRNGRHTLWACLAADAMGVLASVWFCRWLLT